MKYVLSLSLENSPLKRSFQVTAAFRARGINLGEHRVRWALSELVPDLVEARRNWVSMRCVVFCYCDTCVTHLFGSIRRGPQVYKYADPCWCVDLNLKLFPVFGVYLCGCIDGARLLTTNLCCVHRAGSRVRGDREQTTGITEKQRNAQQCAPLLPPCCPACGRRAAQTRRYGG